MTKIIICGDRNWSDYESMLNFIKSLDKTSIIIQGGCRGADLLAKQAADECGLSCWTVNANWKTYGKAAGPKRNSEMLDCCPDFVVAFHSDIENSKGTKNMVEQARKKQIPVKIIKSIVT